MTQTRDVAYNALEGWHCFLLHLMLLPSWHPSLPLTNKIKQSKQTNNNSTSEILVP